MDIARFGPASDLIHWSFRMRFDYKTFHIDCTAHHGQDGRYYAQARITRSSHEDTARVEAFESGELDAFTTESDAVHCARAWAIEWCDEALA
jgi:hypothetical protein